MLVMLCCILVSLSASESRSFAVSETACRNMTPIHSEFEPQESIAGIQIIPHSTRAFRGQKVKVTLQAVHANFTFRGFLVQARSVQTNEIVGNFLTNSDEKIMACGNSYSTASHSNPSIKSNQILMWKAPKNFKGSVQFHATIVESFQVFWTNLRSSQLMVI